MKGIVLAGDSGMGLFPLTLAIPKQLLPVFNKPMVYYPIETLVRAGITEILIITTSEHQSLFKTTLGDGSTFGALLSYATQYKPNGIAEAIKIANDFIDSEGVCLITGDTILTDTDISPLIHKAFKAVKNSGSATIFVKRDPDDNQYGKVILNRNGKCETIVGSSNIHIYSSIIGLYVYPKDSVLKVDSLKLSDRGLYEITDLNHLYLSEKKLQVIQLSSETKWWDTNSPENLIRLSVYLNGNRIVK